MGVLMLPRETRRAKRLSMHKGRYVLRASKQALGRGLGNAWGDVNPKRQKFPRMPRFQLPRIN